MRRCPIAAAGLAIARCRSVASKQRKWRLWAAGPTAATTAVRRTSAPGLVGPTLLSLLLPVLSSIKLEAAAAAAAAGATCKVYECQRV